MSAVASKLMLTPALRVAIFAAEPRRLAFLSQWMRDFGHVVVMAYEKPSVVLIDGVVAAAGTLPTVALGMDSETYQRSEEHTSELQSPDHLVCRLLLEKTRRNTRNTHD